MNVDFNSYPDWWHRQLVEDALPWHYGINMSFKEFKDKYTLHDSYWIGIFYDVVQQTATLAIKWDPVWLPNEIKQNISIVNESLYLFIQLKQVEEISTSNAVDTMGLYLNVIFGCQFEKVDGKNFLFIDYGSDLNIIYRGAERFLAMNRNQYLLQI